MSGIIFKTRQHFIAIYEQNILDAINGLYPVNDLELYVLNQKSKIENMTLGLSDNTFTFKQRAVWLQTGEMYPLLFKTGKVTNDA